MRRRGPMASEIRPPHVYGNFRPSRAERSKKRVSAQQRREGNNDAHRAIIKQLPCCICLKRPPNDGHHLKSGDAQRERGMGMRATDRWLVPLCRAHHDDLESYGSRREYEWSAAHGLLDPYALAEALYNAPKDVQTMTAIVQAHKGT